MIIIQIRPQIGQEYEQVANIGRIAYEAREAIKAMPTQREIAKILGINHLSDTKWTNLSKKWTFSSWIEKYTDRTDCI